MRTEIRVFANSLAELLYYANTHNLTDVYEGAYNALCGLISHEYSETFAIRFSARFELGVASPLGDVLAAIETAKADIEEQAETFSRQ